MWGLLGGLYLGWGLGANDAANVFGTAVASRIISFKNAALLCGFAVILGALLQGEQGIETYSELTRQTSTTLVIVSFAAAITVTIMTLVGLPISTSQAVVGAITGVGLARGAINTAALTKVVICWIGTPIGAMAAAMLIYFLVSRFFRHVPMGMLTRDKLIWSGLIVVGVYGSYALGANNVANVTGIFSGQLPGINDRQLALAGGVAIALGVMTFSWRVMQTVGDRIMPIEPFTAFVAVGAMSLTVHLFAFIGVPVSTSQGIVGAILGVAAMRSIENIRLPILAHIAAGWLMTPAIALVLAAAGMAIFT
jgi:PiT family inorganic phosphate transporter